jgi:hypothetical protein
MAHADAKGERTMRVLALAAGLALLCAPAAATEGVDAFTQKFFGHALKPGVNFACFARVYDAAHLARHPRQNVADMALLARLDAKEPSYYALTLGLHLRRSRELRTTSADCRAQGDGDKTTAVECSAACEGGQVDIKLKDDGSVWLTFPNKGSIWIQSEAGGPPPKPSGLGSDDLLFRLDRAAGAACAPLVTDKDDAAALRRQP